MSAAIELPHGSSPFRQPSRRDGSETTAWPAGRLDVRFDSDEALHRAVALLDGQTWVEDCRIDLGERTLHLRFAGGAAAPGFALAAAGDAVH